MAIGAAKAAAPFGKIFQLGVVSGAHIAFGGYLAISVGGACPGIAATNPGLQKVRKTKTTMANSNSAWLSLTLFVFLIDRLFSVRSDYHSVS